MIGNYFSAIQTHIKSLGKNLSPENKRTKISDRKRYHEENIPLPTLRKSKILSRGTSHDENNLGCH